MPRIEPWAAGSEANHSTTLQTANQSGFELLSYYARASGKDHLLVIESLRFAVVISGKDFKSELYYCRLWDKICA